MTHPLSISHEGEEPDAGKQRADLWETLQRDLPDARRQRLAFLLFHCGLRPREIVRLCPQEFCYLQDIYRLRRTIFEQVLQTGAFQPYLVPEEVQQHS